MMPATRQLASTAGAPLFRRAMAASESDTVPGRLHTFLAADHQQLDTLLAMATAGPTIDLQAYARFRAGLLKHIGMEEKILLPAVQQLNDGQPLPIAAKLRLDHGAIAALLVPSPTRGIIGLLRRILSAHNLIEEAPNGLYVTCDRLAGNDWEPLLERLQRAPEVPVAAHADSPLVIPATIRALARAGYDVTAADLA